MRNFFSMLVGGLLGLATTAAAQEGPQAVPVRLRWGTYAELPTGNPDVTRRLPSFRGANFRRDDVVGTYTQRLPGAVASAAIVDATYEPFSEADAKLLGRAALPAAPPLTLRRATETRQPVTYALVQPARRNPQTGQPERLVSFTLSYQPGDAPAARTAAAHVFAHQSVLYRGDWFKIGVPRSGVYKLDRDALQQLGLPVGSLDPRRLQLFGNAVGMLPQPNAAPRPDDLVENNIVFVGDNSATFDAGEYFLFYAPGPHTWRASRPGQAAQTSNPGYRELLGEDGRFKHLNNVYCDTAYYFVTVGTGNGRRVPTAAAPTAAPTGAAVTTFLDRRFYEHDLVNLLHSGRRWVGESFTTTAPTRDITFDKEGYPGLADLVPGDTLRLTAATAAASSRPSTFALALDGVALGSQEQDALPGCDIQAAGTNSFRTYTTRLAAGSPNANPKVTLNFNSADATATGYLDYLELVVKRRLNFPGAYLEFNSRNSVYGVGTARTFTLTNASGVEVWDVTNPRRPLLRTLDGSGSFVAPTDSLREYVAVQRTGSGFGAPRLFGRVGNQNLHALNLDGKLDLVIVTHPVLKDAAEKLAQHRRDYSGLNVVVLTTTQIYNEYSSGGQDVTAIRDLMKQVYDRNPSPGSRRLSLLLFGDASFDYKSSWRNDASQQPSWWSQRAPFKSTADFNKANQNYVPTYESRESFLAVFCYRQNADGENSYSSEDYYGLLDDTEGEWVEESGRTFEATDISIGRVPVRTPADSHGDASDAVAVVQKIIDYDSPNSFGKWRNYMALTADDEEGSSAFVIESESLFAPTLSGHEPAYNLRKDYLDLFPQISVSAGQRSPACVAAIDASLEQGSLVMGYTGHGGPSGLANEQLITKASLLALQNQNRLTFLVTGTCDLSTYDNPDYTSAGEAVLTDNLRAGAVGLFTTTRVVYALFNTQVVNNFYDQLLTRGASGTMPTLGAVASLAKNASPAGDLNNRNYTLLADPTCRLAYPRQRVVVDSINGHRVRSMVSSRDTLQALRKVRISGHIENGGVLNASFGGTASITIFDKPVNVMTLGDQNSPPTPVKVQNTVIYDGQAAVANGRWTTTFVVPKDIAYAADSTGKISLYAQDLVNRVDANGYQLVPIGGAARQVAADTRPPRISLFMTDEIKAPNDTSFVNGGTTPATTLLLGRLYDESGINTSNAGVGHDLTATLDGDPVKITVLNSAYTADVGRYTAGTVRYLYKELATGPHTLALKAWDTYNNSAERKLDFIVAGNEQLALTHVLNYPNPFVGSTTFHFDQNRPGQELDVQVQIFTVTGRLVKTLRASFPSSTSHVPANLRDAQLTWDGRDDYQDQLARGVYVYRISIRTGGQTATKYEKLVLLN